MNVTCSGVVSTWRLHESKIGGPAMKRVAFFLVFLACIGIWNGKCEGGWTANMAVYATIDAGNSDRAHLRAQPDTQAQSKGLYFTGTQVSCPQGITQGWTYVTIGAEEGYMMTQYLRTGDAALSVKPEQPYGTVHTTSWVNVRTTASIDAQIVGQSYNGDQMTVWGETASHWYYGVVSGVTGYVSTAYVTLQSGEESAQKGMAGGTSQWVTETVDPQESLEAFITAVGCTIHVVPTSDRMVTCYYDANALHFSHDIARGAQIFHIERKEKASSKDSIVTMEIPEGVYHQIYLDVQEGTGSMAGDFQCYRVVYGKHAQLSLGMPATSQRGYLLSLIDSQCVFGIGETTQNYAIKIEGITQSSLVLPRDWPSYQVGAEIYSYANGSGTVQVNVQGLQNSNLEFAFVR